MGVFCLATKVQRCQPEWLDIFPAREPLHGVLDPRSKTMAPFASERVAGEASRQMSPETLQVPRDGHEAANFRPWPSLTLSGSASLQIKIASAASAMSQTLPHCAHNGSGLVTWLPICTIPHKHPK